MNNKNFHSHFSTILFITLITILSTATFVFAEGSAADADWDQDGISDADELMLANKYSPLLIFDEDEQEDINSTLYPLYQVSPVNHPNGSSGAMLTFVFLYDEDYGADFDRSWTDWFTDPIDTTFGFFADPFDQFFGYHCGDTEVIYFYIEKRGSWNDTWLSSIYWKRHYDPIYETSQSVVQYDDFRGTSSRTHPVIYVSEDKHGMYPDKDSCENYKTDVIQVRAEDWVKDNITIGPLDNLVYIPVTPKMEDCDGGLWYEVKNLPQILNVGEGRSEETMNRFALQGTIYEGYDPWLNQPFWGRSDIAKVCQNPAGGLGGKWCGSPYPSSKDHPCGADNWFGTDTGYCMNSGTDRFGYDYSRTVMDMYDATACAQMCIDDDRCVSYSFVLPGIHDELGVCYLKEAAPPQYPNDCCISGLKSDCVY